MNFSDPKLHLLLQSNHTKTVNDIISDSTCSYESFLVIYLNIYIVFLQKTVHTGTSLVTTDEFDHVIGKWKEDFDYIFCIPLKYLSFLPRTLLQGNAMEWS